MTAYIFLAIPLTFWACLIWFILSLCRYIAAKRKNKQVPGHYDAMEINQRRFMMILSGAVLATFFLVVFGFIAMLYTSVAYM